MSEKRRALIIGNSEYQDVALHRLASPAEDAKELASVLGDETIGGFEIETLMNQTSARISEAIEEFFVFSNPKPDDLLLFYFSGHGVTDEEGNLYFAATDTQFVKQRIRRATAVSADFVDSVMRRSRSRRQILMLDCCHGGAFAEGMSLKGPLPALETHFQGRGRIVLTASTAVQFSLEGLSDGGAQPSVYTRILVGGLKSGDADRDADGWVSLDELHDYLLDGVHVESPQQTPTKSGYLEGQLYIARAPGARPASLPRTLQNALQDPDPITRRGAVSELGELLLGQHTGLALAARQALEIRRDTDDSFKIRAAAANYLATQDPRGTIAAKAVAPVANPKTTIKLTPENVTTHDANKLPPESSALSEKGAQGDLPKKKLFSDEPDALPKQREHASQVITGQGSASGLRSESTAKSDVPTPSLLRVSEVLSNSLEEPKPLVGTLISPESRTTPSASAAPSEDAGKSLPRVVLFRGALVAGLGAGILNFAIWEMSTWIHISWIFWFTPCLFGLVLALTIRRFSAKLLKKHVILICLAWPFTNLLIYGAISESLRPWINSVYRSPLWIRRFDAALYIPESALRGALTGLILAWSFARNRWGGIAICTISFVTAAFLWLIPVYWITQPNSFVYTLATALEYAIVASALIWYIDLPSKS